VAAPTWEETIVKRSLVLGFAIVLLTSPAARGVTRVTIGTGPWGGVFFPVGSALATLLNRYVPDIRASAEPVEGSAHALALLAHKNADAALILAS
jgi:hypothetical protein